jgi:hypothetical protein
MTVQEWLASAIADAERRGLAGLKPLLEGLARTTDALRQADDELRESASSTLAPGGDHERG